MKRIFTLFVLAILFFNSTNAQINQTFESVAGLSSLTSACWQFSGILHSTEGKLNDNNSLEATSVTSTTIFASITTPYVNLTAGGVIQFNYRLGSKLSTNSTRTMTVRLVALDGTSVTIGSISMDKFFTTGALTFSGISPVTGVRKIEISIQGTGDGNSPIYIDNMHIDGSFNYNTPYNCFGSAQAPLPIRLKSFQGSSANDKVVLQWTVAGNEECDLFEVERSEDGKSFQTIGIVFGSQKQGDESYSYKDGIQTSAIYRLKAVGKNKAFIYSQILVMKKQAKVNNTLTLLQNPVQQTVRFGFVSESNANTDVTIYNMLGVKVYQTKFAAIKGYNVTSVELAAQLTTGHYVVEVKNQTGVSTAKFVKN